MTQTSTDSTKGTVLSGMRPTGDLHVGHFEGVLRNWIQLQDTHKCFYFVADWHALTTETSTKDLERHTLDMVKDWIAFGVDPTKSTIFIQSYVPQHAELGLILERLVNIGAAERVPTFKAQAEHMAGDRIIKDIGGNILEGEERLRAVSRSDLSLGFMAYPVLQAADILLYQATHVPVGEDQVPHIELTRELGRRFNQIYGEVFPIPEAMLNEAKRIRGIDGRKMSKSYGNAISPDQTPEELETGVRRMVTVRPRMKDKGDPFECAVYDLHKVFNTTGQRDVTIAQSCRDASIRCLDCKLELPPLMAVSYEQFRERRGVITDDYVRDVLRDGNKKAREVAAQTMERVRHHMLLNYLD